MEIYTIDYNNGWSYQYGRDEGGEPYEEFLDGVTCFNACGSDPIVENEEDEVED